MTASPNGLELENDPQTGECGVDAVREPHQVLHFLCVVPMVHKIMRPARRLEPHLQECLGGLAGLGPFTIEEQGQVSLQRTRRPYRGVSTSIPRPHPTEWFFPKPQVPRPNGGTLRCWPTQTPLGSKQRPDPRTARPQGGRRPACGTPWTPPGPPRWRTGSWPTSRIRLSTCPPGPAARITVADAGWRTSFRERKGPARTRRTRRAGANPGRTGSACLDATSACSGPPGRFPPI